MLPIFSDVEDNAPPETSGYLIRRLRYTAKVAHVWTGRDTACRMWSTGGLRKDKYEYSVGSDDLPICTQCLAVASRSTRTRYQSAR